jgi:hypothetical protein
VNNWDYVTQAPEVSTELNLKIYQDGAEMDFTMMNTYPIPIVSARIKDELSSITELAFLAVNILDKNCLQKYYVMVVGKTVDCVDESKSKFRKFVVNDPVRPDKAGDYRSFFELRVDPQKITGVDIFRVAKFDVAIIVSERVKLRLETCKVTGLDFDLV